MSWTVTKARKVEKAERDLPKPVRDALIALMKMIEVSGPVIGWKGFGALKQLGEWYYHAHLKGGHPTYVAVWRVVDKVGKQVEVTYVGTHEKAPY